MAKWIDPMWVAWTAGIIDGEGTVTITPRKRTDRTCRFAGFTVKVTVGNTNRAMTDKLHELWGGSIRLSKSSRHNHADSHQWTVVAQNALNVLLACHPYLVTKHEQGKIALALQERITGGVGYISNLSHNRRSGLKAEEIQLRTALYEHIRELNVKPGVRQWQIAG